MRTVALWVCFAILASTPEATADSRARAIAVRKMSNVRLSGDYGFWDKAPGFYRLLWEHLEFIDVEGTDVHHQQQSDRLAQPVPVGRRI